MEDKIEVYQLVSEFSPRNADNKEALLEIENYIRKHHALFRGTPYDDLKAGEKTWIYRRLSEDIQDDMSLIYGVTVCWDIKTKRIEFRFRVIAETEERSWVATVRDCFLKDVIDYEMIELKPAITDFIRQMNTFSKFMIERCEKDEATAKDLYLKKEAEWAASYFKYESKDNQ